MDLHFRSSTVEIKTPREIDAMREVGRLAGDTLTKVAELVRPGITTNEINAFVHEDTLKKGARPGTARMGKLMTPKPRGIAPEALATEAVALMERHRISQLLVVDAAGELVGALNMNDLLRAKVV